MDNNGIACILTEGYCPDRHTQYKGVYRLATDEYLLIKKDGLKRNKKIPSPLKIDENIKLERYCDTLKTAILSRASNTTNWVETSGGWDSATILGTLRTYNCKNIRAVTVSVSLSDGLNFNKYEVSKSQELAKYYNIPLTIIDFNLNDDALLHTFRSNLEVIKNQHIFDTQSLWRPVMYDVVNAKGEEGAVCFNGLFSDSIHNFGFSQYLTLIDNSTAFREFADKMATYLYSPSFLKKIPDSSYSKDFVYRIFQWHNRMKDTDIYEVHSQMDKLNKYLLSFIYGRYRTVPFSKPFVSDYMTESGTREFEHFLVDNYILPLAELLNDETVYFVFLELYKHFYLQGCEQKQVLYGLNFDRVKPAIPFLDGDLLNIMSQAPEDWGRGVSSWNNTKYPLKQYAASQIDFSEEILSNHKCHAYIYENEAHRNVNLNNELMYRSVFARELFDGIDPKMIENYFDDKYFDTERLKGLIANRSDCSSFKKRLLMYLTIMDVT